MPFDSMLGRKVPGTLSRPVLTGGENNDKVEDYTIQESKND